MFRGKFEKGIYVKTEANCVLRYDFVYLSMSGSRDCFKSEALQELILNFLATRLDVVARPLFAALVQAKSSKVESDATIYCSSQCLRLNLAQKISVVFRDEFGNDTCPCKQDELEYFKRIFSDKAYKVLPTFLVDILRIGGIRNVTQEEKKDVLVPESFQNTN